MDYTYVLLTVSFGLICRSARFSAGEGSNNIWRRNGHQPKLPTQLSQEYNVSVEASGA